MNKFLLSLALTALFFTVAVNAQKTATAPGNPLIASLPASDAVASFDAQKFLGSALPELLGADSPQMAKINAHLDLIKTKTGLDLRQFENVAVGIKYKQVSPAEIDFEPVMVTSGKFNAGAMIALVKIAANGKYREEKFAGKSVYVLQLDQLLAEVQKQAPAAKSSGIEKLVEKLLRTFSGEFAIGALNEKTLAMGSVSRVQAAFSASAPLDRDLKTMANSKPGAIMSFAGNMPAGASKMFGLDNEVIAATLDSMKQVYGHLDMNAGNASLMLAAKTGGADQAENLEDTLNGLKSLGQAFIGMLKASPQEREMYQRMIDSAKITRAGLQVQIDLAIPQSDLSILTKKL
jgi:hypothetical protein